MVLKSLSLTQKITTKWINGGFWGLVQIYEIDENDGILYEFSKH